MFELDAMESAYILGIGDDIVTEGIIQTLKDKKLISDTTHKLKLALRAALRDSNIYNKLQFDEVAYKFGVKLIEATENDISFKICDSDEEIIEKGGRVVVNKVIELMKPFVESHKRMDDITTSEGDDVIITLVSVGNESAVSDDFNWTGIPLNSIGGISFNMTRDIVRKVAQRRPIQEFKYGKLLDDFTDCKVHYDKDGRCKAVEVFRGITVRVKGKVVFPGNINKAEKVLGPFVKEGNKYVLREKSIAIAVDNQGEATSIVFAEKGYFNR